MSATDPLRDEHRALLPLIEDIRIAAEAADVISRTTLVAEIDAVLRFLTGHLVPHARAEEAALYPAVERILGAPGATATMTRDHVEVVRLIDELTVERDALAGGAGPDRVHTVQRLLYGLYAVLRLHFAKEEEEVYLPLLDAALTPAQAGAMFAAMNVAAHAAAH